MKFTSDFMSRGWNGKIECYSWKGLKVSYRPGTSDAWLIYSILLKSGKKSEYFPPPEFGMAYDSVSTVLDIGANVGIASLYFSHIFPNAVIHAFEPSPDNFMVLEKNTIENPRIKPYQFALGDTDGQLDLYECASPTNYGGMSVFDEDVNKGSSVSVPVKNSKSALHELGLDSVDVIKIDTEGAEWEILTSMDLDVLKKVKLIMGELHGRKDFALLDYLQPHFRIGMRKSIRSRLFNFYAVPYE
jgi:FkbM family methyltransferase